MNDDAQSIELKALSTLRRHSLRRRAVCADYARFTELKTRWIASNPEATTTDYDAAIHRFARECGV